jgi:uracil phosphoribosyltransferase
LQPIFVLHISPPTLDNTYSLLFLTNQWGVPKIHVISVIASKQGLTELLTHIPDLHVTLGHIDEELNADGDVLPGLGDSGDRLFGTGPVEQDEEELVHPSKRKRSGSLASEAGSSR